MEPLFRTLLFLFSVSSILGCEDFTWTSGKLRCDETGACPDGLSCQGGLCTDTTASDTDFGSERVDPEIEADTGAVKGTGIEKCDDVTDCLRGGECAAVTCVSGADPGGAGLCRYLPDATRCADEGECAADIVCELGSAGAGWSCGHRKLEQSLCTDIGECGEGLCADNEEGVAACESHGAAAKCKKKQCGLQSCDLQGDSWVCSYKAALNMCPKSECGTAECNEAFTCVYTPLEGDCPSEDGKCGRGTCMDSGPGIPPLCKFDVDWYDCDSGETCSEQADFSCLAGNCPIDALGEATRVSETENPTVAPSIFPSVTGVKGGFATAWMDKKHGQSHFEIYFALFNDEGELRPGSERRVAPGQLGQYPRLIAVKREFVLIFQGWPERHEILLYTLDENGTRMEEEPLQVSDNDDSEAFYPDAVFEKKSGRIGIVWSYRPNWDTSWKNIDVHSAVYDIESQELVFTEQAVIELSGSEKWPKVSAGENGFLSAAQTVDNTVFTRFFGTDGGMDKAMPSQVTPRGTATKPLALAWDGEEHFGLTWRSTLHEASVFKLLDSDGESAIGSAPLAIGGALNVSASVLKGYFGVHSLAWDAESGLFVFSWEATGNSGFGNLNQANVFVTRISADGKSMESPWRLGDGLHRTAQPQVAFGDDRALIVWHDNQDQVDETSWVGEIYSAPFGCL